MRHIHLADNLRLRFPARGGDFNEGVEIGMLAALMSLGQGEIKRRIAAGSLEQMSAVAAKLGYHLAGTIDGLDWVEVTFRAGRARPKLRLVPPAGEARRLQASAG